MTRLLIITPEYPYPQKCGFTVRVGDLCRHLAKSVTIDLFVCRHLADPVSATHEDCHSLHANSAPGNAEPQLGTAFPTGPIKAEHLPGRETFRQVFATAGANAGLPTPQRPLDRLARRLFPPHFDAPCYLPDAILAQLAEIQSREKYDACMIQTPLLARCLSAIQGDTLKIVDAHDIWHQKYLGFKALGCGNLLAQFRDAERELAFYRSADHVLAISLWDHEHLLAHGVNSIYTPVAFSADPLPERSPPGHDLLMASGSGPFNMDAVRFFVADILPLVLKEIPDVRLKIANPAPEITKDYSGHPQVVLLPFFDHPRDLYAQADLAIAPLRFTSGLKIKVLESFAFGKPIILSPAADQGIPMANYAQRVVSSKPPEFAAEIVAALRDPEYRRALAAAGLNLIETAYSRDQSYRELMSML
jgi:glycosyltransferase involved in cell wall biosynthesis